MNFVSMVLKSKSASMASIPTSSSSSSSSAAADAPKKSVFAKQRTAWRLSTGFFGKSDHDSNSEKKDIPAPLKGEKLFAANYDVCTVTDTTYNEDERRR